MRLSGTKPLADLAMSADGGLQGARFQGGRSGHLCQLRHCQGAQLSCKGPAREHTTADSQCLPQSIARQGLSTLREATKNYDASLLQPPRNEMAFQQVI